MSIKIKLLKTGLFLLIIYLSGCNGQELQKNSNLNQFQNDNSNLCPIPQAPVFSRIHKGASLEFKVENNIAVQSGVTNDIKNNEPDHWFDNNLVQFDTTGTYKVFSRLNKPECLNNKWFTHVYEVKEYYPAAAEEEDSTAIHMDDPRLIEWATGYVEPINYGEEVEDKWKTPQKALGKAVGTSIDILCTGRGGSVILTFDNPIKNGSGFDFAIFENSFDSTFLELAFVEVSSNGNDFIRFDNSYLGNEKIDVYEGHVANLIEGLAGKYKQKYGTPFDLNVLSNKSKVISGLINLNNINYIKIIDIDGSGVRFDSFNNPIYDPYPCTSSAGFDLDAVGVINN